MKRVTTIRVIVTATDEQSAIELTRKSEPHSLVSIISILDIPLGEVWYLDELPE